VLESGEDADGDVDGFAEKRHLAFELFLLLRVASLIRDEDDGEAADARGSAELTRGRKERNVPVLVQLAKARKDLRVEELPVELVSRESVAALGSDDRSVDIFGCQGSALTNIEREGGRTERCNLAASLHLAENEMPTAPRACSQLREPLVGFLRPLSRW